VCEWLWERVPGACSAMSSAIRCALSLIGVAAGTVGSAVAARLIASLLFGNLTLGCSLLCRHDPFARCKCDSSQAILPARRASRIDPIQALRNN